MTTRPAFRRRLILAAAVAGTLLAMAVPVGAAPLPLSPTPTATLSCDDGVSTFTMHWPVGEYADWHAIDDILGGVSGSGGIYTVPTDESFTVPSGWEADHTTVKLNLDTVGDTSYNQDHFGVAGSSCPFSTPVTVSIECTGRTLSTSISAGHVTDIAVYDQDDNLVYSQYYPRYGIFGDLEEDVQVGPVVLDALLSETVTSVRVVVTVDHTALSATLDTACIPVPPSSVEVRGADGEIHQTAPCHGTATTTVQAGSITVERTDADAEATVGLAYTGDLVASLGGDLPTTVHFDVGQHEVVIPVTSEVPGSLEVSLVDGLGYVVGTHGSASVEITRVVSRTGCDGDPGGSDGSDPVVRPTTPQGPVGPGQPPSAPPADVIGGVAHLTG